MGGDRIAARDWRAASAEARGSGEWVDPKHSKETRASKEIFTFKENMNVLSKAIQFLLISVRRFNSTQSLCTKHHLQHQFQVGTLKLCIVTIIVDVKVWRSPLWRELIEDVSLWTWSYQVQWSEITPTFRWNFKKGQRCQIQRTSNLGEKGNRDWAKTVWWNICMWLFPAIHILLILSGEATLSEGQGRATEPKSSCRDSCCGGAGSKQLS